MNKHECFKCDKCNKFFGIEDTHIVLARIEAQQRKKYKPYQSETYYNKLQDTDKVFCCYNCFSAYLIDIFKINE